MEIGIKKEVWPNDNNATVYLLSEYQGYKLIDGYPDVLEDVEEVLPETYKLTAFYSYKAAIQHIYYDLIPTDDHETLTSWLDSKLAQNVDKMLLKLEMNGVIIKMVGEEE